MKHIRPIFLRKWFPPEDQIAAIVARLTILREDYFMELNGMIADEFNPFDETATNKGFGPLDENSSEWRRLYFFRNSLRSLHEIRNAMDSLYSNPDRRKELAKCSISLQEAFESLKNGIDATKHLVKDLRDNVGGHILFKGVRMALDNMGLHRRGMLEIVETASSTHYRFTTELVLSILIPAVPEAKQWDKLSEILSTTATLVPVIGMMDSVINEYIVDRCLLRE